MTLEQRIERFKAMRQEAKEKNLELENPLTMYCVLIEEATKAPIQQLPQIETVMRERFRTLDGLSPKEFKMEARKALKVLEGSRAKR